MSRNAEAEGYEPEVVVLFCQNAVDETVELVHSNRKLPGFRARLVVLPCSSNIEIRQMMKILEQGADALQIVGCPEHTCRFLVGSALAEKRVAAVRDLLEEIGLGPDRVGMERGMGMSLEGILELAGRRAGMVRALGPNPMREAGTAGPGGSLG